MNRIFKVVWSKSRQAYIVVSEYAKSRGGKTKIVAAVLAVIMGTAVQAPVWAANDRATLDPATQKIVDEVMKQVEANYVKKGTGNGTAVDNDMVKPGENPVKANAEQYGAVAIGRNAHAVQYRTVAIGAGAYANIDGGIAILGNTLQNDGISFGRDSYARGIAGIAIGRDTQSGVNSITIGRMARAAYSRPGNIGNPGAKVTHPLGGDDTNNPVFNKNAVAIGTNSLAGASNIVFLTPGTENTYLDFASTANIWASRVYSRAQMTKIKDGTKKHISDRFYGEGDINTAASDDKKVNFYDVVRDSGTDQVAVGHHSRALGDQAIAIGSNSIAGRYSIVMGGNTFGDGKQNDSFYAMYLNNDGIFRKLSGYRKVDNNPGNPNEGSTYAGEAGVAIGTKAHVLTQMGTAVGALARIEQDSFGAVALGAGASVGTQKAGHDSIGAVAIGMGSAAKGNGTVVLGARASAWPDSGDAHRITAVGYGTIAKNADSVALGSLAEADRGSDMAGYFYGYKAATIDQSKEAGSIQLKLKDGAADLIENYEVKVTPSAWEVPKATETDIENGIRTHVYAGLKGPAFKANAGALSIGKNGSTPDATDAITRQIVNVAAGTNDTDAVNVAQLRNVNMMVEADSAGAGTPKAFSDFLLDNARLKISGQSYLSTELTQDKEGPRITLKAKTTELIANPDGSFSTKNHEDGLITAGELVKRMNAAKQARDELEKKIGELVYLNAKGEKLQQKGGKFFKVNPDGSLDESKEETPAAITSKRQGLQLANVNGAVTQLTPDGLADLSNISEKTGVNVNDISKIGWILSVPDDKYSEAVVHNRKVSFFGKDLAKVTAAGKGEEPRMITVTVDRKETGKAVEQEFLNNGFTQIRYVDANNKPLVRAQDGKYYYPVSDKDNTPDTSKSSVAPAARVADVESHPTVLTNVKHGADVINKTGDPTDGLADLSKDSQKSNVATVEDLRNLGFVIKGKADDDSAVTGQVKHANTVEFAGEDLAHVVVTSKDGKHKVTVKVNKDDVTQAVNAANAQKGTAPTAYVDKDGNPLVKGDDGNYHKVKDDGTLDNDTTDPAGVRLGEKDTPMQLTNVKPGTNEITAEGPTKGLADLEHAVPGTVATVDDLKKMGFVVADGAKYHATVANAQTVKFVGEGLATVTGETKDDVRTFTVKVDKDEVAKAINAEGAKKGTAPTTYVDKDGNPLVKGSDGKYYKPKADGTPDTDGGAVDPAGVRLGEKDKPIQLTNVAPATEAINKANDPTNGLADLANAKSGTVATVDDLKRVGFVVADGGNYHATVTNAQTVKFVGEGLAEVSGKTEDNVRTFTVKVDDKKVADAVKSINDKAGNAPTQYVDKDGNPLVKDGDKYYKAKADGTPDKDAGEQTPAGIKVGEKDKPMQLTNVAPATEAINKPNDPTNGLADLANAKDGTVATVADLKKLGFVIKGKALDGTTDVVAQVKHADTVEFAGEDLAKVVTESKDGVSKVTVKVNKEDIVKVVNDANDKKGSAPTQYVDKDGNPLVKDGDKYYKAKADGTPDKDAGEKTPAGIQVGEKGKTTQLTNVAPATKAIDKENDPTNGLADLANAKSGTVATVDDLKRVGVVVADGADYHETVTNAQTVKFVGEGLAEVSGKTEGEKRVITVKVDDKKVADAVKSINDKAGNAPTQYVDKDGNPLVKDGDKYYKAKDDGTPDKDAGEKTPAGIQVGEKDKPTQLTNVKPGTNEITAEGPTKGLVDLEHAVPGTVATVDDLKRVGFVVADGGNYHATVTNAQTVKFVGEGLAEVSGKTEDNVRTFTVKVDDKKVADAVKSINDKAGNAPTQYVDKDGNPLVKAKDGNYYPKDKVGDDGQPIQGAQAVEPAGIQVGEKGKPTQLTNVAPATEAINKADDPTNGLADLANAKDGTVATVADLKKLGFVIKGKAEDGTTDVVAQVKHADTVEFAGEDLAKVITESANGVSKVTVKVNKEEIAKAVNAENAKKGSEPTTYVDENGDPLVKGDDGKYYKPKADGTPDTDAGEKTPAGIRLGEKDKPIQLDNVARGTETKPVNGKDGQPIMGSDNQPLQLVDLKDAKDTKVATVGDLKDMGFVLGASVNAAGGNKAYQDVVKNGNKVKFVGLGGAWISGKTAADGTRIITIDVNADNLVTGTQNAIQYVDGKGNRMIPMLQKGNEVLYYNAADNPVKHKMPNSDEEAVYRMSDIVEGTGTLKPDAQPLQGKKAADVPNLGVALVHPNGSADTTEGTVLRNVGVGTATIAAPTDDKDIVGKAKAGLADLANSKDTNGLSVADAKKLGFVIKGKAADGTTDVTGQVKHANTVEFAGEDLAKVITESANGVSKVTVKVNKEDIVKVVNDANDKKGSAPTQYVDKDGNPLVKAKDGKYYPKDKVGDDGTPQTGAQAVDPVGIQVGEKDKPTQLMNIAPGTTSIATPTDPNASQADKAKAGLADLSIPTDAASDNVSKHTAATVDDLRRMGWILSVGDTYADKVQNAQEVNFKGAGLAEVSGQTEGQKRVITVTVDEQKVAAAVKAINDKAGNAPIHYVDQEGNPLVKAKDNKYYPTDKVDNEGNVIAGAKDAVPVVQIGEKGHPMQLTNVAAGTSEIKEGPTKGLADLEHAASGTVATVDDLQKLGFVIKGTDENGKAVSGQVRHANTVEFAGDGLAKVITESKDGVSKVTVKVNKEEIAKAVNAENAKNGSAPTQYVDKDGNSLVKDGDKYYKAKDDGTPDTTAGPVDPAGVQIGEKNKPITVTNVKSNFAEVAPDAKEVKAPESKKNPDGSVDPTAANPLVAMQHNAATIADIMNSPWNLQVNGKAVKAVKSFDTVNITDGTNTKVVATETGYKVNVVGLPTAYTDNAGNTIAKGTDGKWFVTDKDGNMTATPADLGQDGKGTPSVSLVNPAAEPGKAGEPVVMHNVGQGNLPTDAVNKDQMDTAIAGMAKAIGNTKDEAHGIGADAAALAALKPLQYDPVEPTQIMAGIGNYQQKTAVALGVAHYTNESTMLNAGVSLGTGHTMVNVGYTRKFGHTKDEKEIPDRYKAGPISSIYVMQDEVSALKAENEQQKREIQELREMVLAMAANKK